MYKSKFLFVSDSIANRPKRPTTQSYILFLNENRERIKNESPGLSVTGIAKRGGELWKELPIVEQNQWKQKATEARDRYRQSVVEAKQAEEQRQRLQEQQRLQQQQQQRLQQQQQQRQRQLQQQQEQQVQQVQQLFYKCEYIKSEDPYKY